jgi:hypothetical protein
LAKEFPVPLEVNIALDRVAIPGTSLPLPRILFLDRHPLCALPYAWHMRQSMGRRSLARSALADRRPLPFE